ncbi:MAG: nuclear transport factor 2 family protein [Anaerolineales bacterium]|nr:nuclear transport factor 2 family protein [Anaerolineales bacterium]
MKPTDASPEKSSPEGRASILAAAYASAYAAKDASAYLALFSDEADYFDFAVQIHARIKQLRIELRRSFQREEFDLAFHSSFVSSDGRFAALKGTYSDLARSGDRSSVPLAAMLEFRDGKIIKEILYYDGSLFKRHLHAG